MLSVEGDELESAGSGPSLYVALLCAFDGAALVWADRVLSELEHATGVTDRCASCAFSDTCVKRALTGGLVRARAWVVRTERQARVIG